MHKKDHQDKNWWFLITVFKVDPGLPRFERVYHLSLFEFS